MMTWADRVVVALAVAMLPFLYHAYWGDHTQGQAVRIFAPGQPATTVSLNQTRELTVQGPLGPSTIEIDRGKVRFVDSPCHNKLCIRAGWLSRGGEFAACLPNRISLVVIGREQRYDAINF
jgi:hypothetical protein